jgi:FkbM family methyltransferase
MSLILKDCLVFDIGANIGQSADQFVKAGAGRVISVEPCIENFLVLARREKTTPILAAAWNKPTIINAHFALNTSGWSSVQPEKWIQAYPTAQWGAPQAVITVTLDMLREVYGEPHAIKIDVEGSEYEVFQGLTKRCPVLWFEFHGKFVQDALNCLDYCQRLGFTKAHYEREDINTDIVPTMGIDEFRQRWLKDAPEWGNITVV